MPGPSKLFFKKFCRNFYKSVKITSFWRVGIIVFEPFLTDLQWFPDYHFFIIFLHNCPECPGLPMVATGPFAILKHIFWDNFSRSIEWYRSRCISFPFVIEHYCKLAAFIHLVKSRNVLYRVAQNYPDNFFLK